MTSNADNWPPQAGASTTKANVRSPSPHSSFSRPNTSTPSRPTNTSTSYNAQADYNTSSTDKSYLKTIAKPRLIAEHDNDVEVIFIDEDGDYNSHSIPRDNSNEGSDSGEDDERIVDSEMEVGSESEGDESFDYAGPNDESGMQEDEDESEVQEGTDAGEPANVGKEDANSRDKNEEVDESYETSDGADLKPRVIDVDQDEGMDDRVEDSRAAAPKPEIIDLDSPGFIQRYTEIKSVTTTTTKTVVTPANKSIKSLKSLKPSHVAQPVPAKPPAKANSEPSTPTKFTKAHSEPNTPIPKTTTPAKTITKIPRPTSASKVTTTTTTTTTTSKKITDFFQASPKKPVVDKDSSADKEKQFLKRSADGPVSKEKKSRVSLDGQEGSDISKYLSQHRSFDISKPSRKPSVKLNDVVVLVDSPASTFRKSAPAAQKKEEQKKDVKKEVQKKEEQKKEEHKKIKKKKKKNSVKLGTPKPGPKNENSVNRHEVGGKLKFTEDGDDVNSTERDPSLAHKFSSLKDTSQIACLFCRKTESQTTCEGKMMYEVKTNINIHFECLYSASRDVNETITQMVLRIAGKGRRWLTCKHCKEKPASLGCAVSTCREVYHYKCGLLAGGKWDPASWLFYCKEHIEAQNVDMIPTYKVLVRWPNYVKVNYLRDSVWSEIKAEHIDYIARFARIEGPRANDEDDMWTVAWESQDFTPRIEIREIGPGHWAWCPQLGDKRAKSTRQYEAVASSPIRRDEFIGEYVGRVRYENPKTLRNPYVTSMFIPTNPQFRQKMGADFAGLCIDSSREGNETRFINSVTRHSPPHMRQNATMDTVWCRGQLRVIIRAIQFIPQGWPIILNYDEYIKADGTHPYFDSDSENEGKDEKHVPYVVNNVLIPKSTVVVPLVPPLPKKGETNPPKI